MVTSRRSSLPAKKKGCAVLKYQTVIPGRFLARPNRFIAKVETAEGVQTVHVKNTGRCRELLVPGAVVYLEEHREPNRKTPYDLIAVEKGRLAMFLVIFLVCGAAGAIAHIAESVGSGTVFAFQGPVLGVTLLAALVLTAVSVPLSMRFYTKRQS